MPFTGLPRPSAPHPVRVHRVQVGVCPFALFAALCHTAVLRVTFAAWCSRGGVWWGACRYRGKLLDVEDNMNVQMQNVVRTDRLGRTSEVRDPSSPLLSMHAYTNPRHHHHHHHHRHHHHHHHMNGEASV